MVQRILKRAEESEVKRDDDNEATIRTRIATFLKNTNEILVQYPSQTRNVSTSEAWSANYINNLIPCSKYIACTCRSTVNVQLMKFSLML